MWYGRSGAVRQAEQSSWCTKETRKECFWCGLYTHDTQQQLSKVRSAQPVCFALCCCYAEQINDDDKIKTKTRRRREHARFQENCSSIRFAIRFYFTIISNIQKKNKHSPWIMLKMISHTIFGCGDLIQIRRWRFSQFNANGKWWFMFRFWRCSGRVVC